MKDSGITAASITGGPFLPLAGGRMTGVIAMATNSITSVGKISGATNTRTADNIVSNIGASTSGNLAKYVRNQWQSNN